MRVPRHLESVSKALFLLFSDLHSPGKEGSYVKLNMPMYSFPRVLLLHELVFGISSIVPIKYQKHFQCNGVLENVDNCRYALLQLHSCQETDALTIALAEIFNPPKESTGNNNRQIRLSLNLKGDSFGFLRTFRPF